MTVESTPRMPRDGRARERLREAQQQESRAVASVCAAGDRLSRARAKRDAVYVTATVKVERAEADLDSARASLVQVSGLDRAALLLGLDVAELRRSVGSRSSRTHARESD
jgi:hypothetical protein